MGLPLFKSVQPDLSQTLPHQWFQVRLRNSKLPRAKSYVLENCCGDQLIIGVLEQKPDALTNRFEVVRINGLAANPDGRLGRDALREETIEMQQQRGFAGTVGAKYSHAFLVIDGEGELVQGEAAMMWVLVRKPADLQGSTQFQPRAHMAMD